MMAVHPRHECAFLPVHREPGQQPSVQGETALDTLERTTVLKAGVKIWAENLFFMELSIIPFFPEIRDHQIQPQRKEHLCRGFSFCQ